MFLTIMNLEYLLMAYEALVANKIRTLLSMLGIIIGVSTVIVVVGIGLGSQEKIAEQYKNMSVESIVVMGGGGPGRGSSSKLDIDDVPFVLQNAEYIKEGTAVYRGSTDVSYGKTSSSYDILGSQSNVFDVANLTVQYGRFFTEEEADSRDKLAVLGYSIAEELFEEDIESAIGETLTIKGKKIEIVGVLKENGVSNRMASYDTTIFLPYQTAEKNILGSSGRVMITFLADGVENLQSGMTELENLLRANHKLKSSVENDFRMFDAGSMVSSAVDSAQTMTILLTSVAAIVLIVSGIGIMNVMFVTVAERTKEIGVMKAIGAEQSSILIQFLLESVLLSVFGGIFGILLGQGIIPFLNTLEGWYVIPSMEGVLVAFVFSVTVGIFFGFYPALQASKLDPVDALRSE